jgi:hypothetical protein
MWREGSIGEVDLCADYIILSTRKEEEEEEGVEGRGLKELFNSI